MIKGRQPVDIVGDAAFCIMFIGFWRRDIDLRANESASLGPKVARFDQNCLTNETCHDVVLTCTTVILSMKLFWTHYKNVKVDWSRVSNRFSEYLFQVSL